MTTKTTSIEEPAAPAEDAADAPLIDSVGAAIKKLIARGKERGYVTYDELNAALPTDQVSSEQIEDTMATLSELGVNVVEAEDSEDVEAEDAEDNADGRARRKDGEGRRDRIDDPMSRERLVREAAARGKYAPLHRHLLALRGRSEWCASFGDIEDVLGFRLPVSARLYAPWWANGRGGGSSQSRAWQTAGWRTRAVDIESEMLIFERAGGAPAGRDAFSISEILPPHDPGPWPEGFTASREQIYGDEER